MSNKLSAIIMRCMGAVAKHFHICHNYRPAGFGYWCSNNNKHFGLYDKQTNKSKKKNKTNQSIRRMEIEQEWKKTRERERKKNTFISKTDQIGLNQQF